MAKVRRKGMSINSRKIRRGDLVRTPEGAEEVVRGVQIVLQLANGQSVPYDANDEVEVFPPDELPDEETR